MTFLVKTFLKLILSMAFFTMGCGLAANLDEIKHSNDSETSSDPVDSSLDSNSDSNTDTNKETPTDIDTATDTNSDSSRVTNKDTNSDTETDTNCDTSSDSNSETNCCGIKCESNCDTDSDTDGLKDSESDTGNNCEQMGWECGSGDNNIGIFIDCDVDFVCSNDHEECIAHKCEICSANDRCGSECLPCNINKPFCNYDLDKGIDVEDAECVECLTSDDCSSGKPHCDTASYSCY